jgi:hypothetical protein
VWEEESGGEGCMRKRKGIRRSILGGRAEKAICGIAFVKLLTIGTLQAPGARCPSSTTGPKLHSRIQGGH